MPIRRVPRPSLLRLLALLAFTAPFHADAQTFAPERPRQLERALRYTPDAGDFVIENGGEFFNRPLYGTHTAFRVDGGDRPEWSLYLPGRGGNLRLGLVAADGSVRWLHDAARIITRYRPGALRHEITDPALGAGARLVVDSVPCATADGLLVRVEARGLGAPITLGWAYGGASGQRGIRGGDIGTEKVPIAQYFQFSPGNAADQTIEINSDATFVLRAKRGTLAGASFPPSALSVADAGTWDSPFAAIITRTGSAPERPILAGRVALAADTPVFIGVERIRETDTAPGGAALPARYLAAETRRLAVQNQVRVSTPDPYLDTAVGALNLAADGVWDEEQGAVMHGAVAWRSKLLGWRGPYANDALGWHERARRHFTYWAGQQKVGELPAVLPPPEEATHLARSRTALHSPGAMSFNHYDMNLVYIDALFRHLMWTGDVAYAREVWPVIERHLAWERRLFRREFGETEKLPLYEAYAAIWASDDLQYHGGGVAYSSAYNHWHNIMAARVARLVGADPAPYEAEAAAIARAMRELLWVPERGAFAEFKDLLGLQLVHPSAGLWSFYHTLDAELVTPAEAWSMTRAIERDLPRLPVRGPGVPEGLAMFSTTNWMPYTWSVNNIVMGENLHTALGFWQAGRADAAYELTRSSLIASLFMGICPGNIGSLNYLDAYRGEAQRDFADGSGVFSRALIEGLFGLAPDLLADELGFTPGFPAAWDHAELRHPDFDVEFSRSENVDTYRVVSRLARPVRLNLQLPRRHVVAELTINGVATPVASLPEWRDAPRIAPLALPAAAEHFEIIVRWSGDAVTQAPAPPFPPAPAADIAAFVAPPAPTADARLEPLDLASVFNDRVTAIFAPGKYRSPRSPHVSLAIPAQGIGAWAGHVNASAEIDDTGLRAASAANNGYLVLPSGVPFATPGPGDAPNVVFTSQWDNYPNEITLPFAGRARRVHLLMAGSTNWMQSRLDNGEVVATYTDGSSTRLPLHNPTTWWPIEQDYFIDTGAFARPEPVPVRVDLKTAKIRVGTPADFSRTKATVPGGAATVLALPLDPAKELRSLTVRSLANEVVIGLLAATLER